MFGLKKVKPSKEELMARMEVLQRDIENLFSENNSLKETGVDLNSTISTNREEIGKLEACISTMTMETEKSSAVIQELETARDALDKALKESTQSLRVKAEELNEMQFQYNTEKKRLEDELCALKKKNEMLNEKLQKEKGERAALCLKITSVENTNLSLNSIISTKQEEIGKLEACVSTLTMETEKSSAIIQELETARDALDKALKESTQSLRVIVEELNEMKFQYNTEKKRLEDEFCALRKENEMLNEKLQKEEGERAALCLKITSVENTNLSLNSIISTKQEEIGKLEACVSTLTMDIGKSYAKIQRLEIAKDASDRALYESIQSLSTSTKIRQEAQSQYNTDKRRLENELSASTKQIEMLNEKLQKEEKEKEVKRKEEEEDMLTEEEEDTLTEEEEDTLTQEEEDTLTEEEKDMLTEEEKDMLPEEEKDILTKGEKGVRRSVLPRSYIPGGDALFAVLAPITGTESIRKHRTKAGELYDSYGLKPWSCCYRFALDISKNNVVAVVGDCDSVYLYSEMNKMKETLCTCRYNVLCLAWDKKGTLLAIGGENNTIQVWDITKRKISKRLKIKHNDQDCYCLDWKGDTITAGSDRYIYQWNINDQDNDEDTQKSKALLPRKTIQNKYRGCIMTVQWSNCKSKLATITYNGDMCIYDEEFKLIHHNEAHDGDNYPLLQWCPWDNQVIATYCWREGYFKVWRVQQDITLIKEVNHESSITNIKWIPSKKAIITAHENTQLVLWGYPSLSIIRTISGHTCIPHYLALNADKSALVSKSDKEMIFWKPFDQF